MKILNRKLWLETICAESDFYGKGNYRKRSEPGFRWNALYSKNKPISQSVRDAGRRIREKLGIRKGYSTDWITNNSEQLFEVRSFLEDDISRLLFDRALILRAVDYERVFFPVFDFNPLAEILEEKDFFRAGFPDNYLGIPLKEFSFRLNEGLGSNLSRKIIAHDHFFSSLNYFRQYLVNRNNIVFAPARGDTVYDCGACIGDMSLVFSEIVGKEGQVHIFDPIPLHHKFIKLQAELNPELEQVFVYNQLAVDGKSYSREGNKSDVEKISPGGLDIEQFSATSLDDYSKSSIGRVGFVKMDIEGFEVSAIAGAENLISEQKPKLAISTYHRPDHMWQIPLQIRKINPDYKFYFGHHSPTIGESVIYATM